MVKMARLIGSSYLGRKSWTRRWSTCRTPSLAQHIATAPPVNYQLGPDLHIATQALFCDPLAPPFWFVHCLFWHFLSLLLHVAFFSFLLYQMAHVTRVWTRLDGRACRDSSSSFVLHRVIDPASELLFLCISFLSQSYSSMLGQNSAFYGLLWYCLRLLRSSLAFILCLRSFLGSFGFSFTFYLSIP
jgi:hypothetical protein